MPPSWRTQTRQKRQTRPATALEPNHQNAPRFGLTSTATHKPRTVCGAHGPEMRWSTSDLDDLDLALPFVLENLPRPQRHCSGGGKTKILCAAPNTSAPMINSNALAMATANPVSQRACAKYCDTSQEPVRVMSRTGSCALHHDDRPPSTVRRRPCEIEELDPARAMLCRYSQTRGWTRGASFLVVWWARIAVASLGTARKE
nr:hypothetical protein CFP56_24063 [Quercus suber]